MKRRYLVIYERGERNFSGFAPDVPGCFSLGGTLKKMRAMMTEALEFHLSAMACDNDPIPEPKTTSFDFGEFAGHPNEGEYYVVEWLNVKIVKSIFKNAKKIEPGHSIIKAARRAQRAAARKQQKEISCQT